MEVRVEKCGNSLAVRLPKPVARDANLMECSVVDVRVVGASSFAEPVGPRYALADLLRGVRKGNLHAEAGTGAPVGREVWQWPDRARPTAATWPG